MAGKNGKARWKLIFRGESDAVYAQRDGSAQNGKGAVRVAVRRSAYRSVCEDVWVRRMRMHTAWKAQLRFMQVRMSCNFQRG